MLALHGKHSVIISRIPVMQNGLGGVMTRHFPDFELTYCSSLQELTLLQLRRADVIIADITGEYWNPRGALEEYFNLLNCSRRAIKPSVRRKTVRCDGCHYAVMPICTPG